MAYVLHYMVSSAGCFHKASSLFRSKTGTIHETIVQFSYYELENATNKFSNSNLIGVGGSSYVYCGQLKDGKTVAVKRLKTKGGPDADLVFLTEVLHHSAIIFNLFVEHSFVASVIMGGVRTTEHSWRFYTMLLCQIELLSRLHHCHVVPLLGYCSESQGKHAQRLLVFEYMLNGNLRDCLDGDSGKNMDWATRVSIALGAARGLEYLHEAAAPRILHRDVKSTNILLDENWRAKVRI